MALDPEVVEARGLDDLRPAEAAHFATLLARNTRGELTHDELLAACRKFAESQAAEWFAGGVRSETPERLRDAAYRIAVAVLDGASLSAVAEAAEVLAWELAVTVDPEATPGRPLFSDGVDARLVSARAVAELGTEEVGTEEVPVRTVRFAGEALAPAVLGHLWQHRHNARGPVLRWLAGLCEDDRPQVWVRAAVAAGQLCRLDLSHTVHELVQPMAQAKQARRRLFAATVLDVALRSPDVGGAIRALVGSWARHGDEQLRWTAGAVLGRGGPRPLRASRWTCSAGSVPGTRAGYGPTRPSRSPTSPAPTPTAGLRTGSAPGCPTNAGPSRTSACRALSSWPPSAWSISGTSTTTWRDTATGR